VIDRFAIIRKGVIRMPELKDIVVIITGERKDGRGRFEGVVVDRNLMFSNLAVQMAKDAGCKVVEVKPKSK
jgi:hypothetical protein